MQSINKRQHQNPEMNATTNSNSINEMLQLLKQYRSSTKNIEHQDRESQCRQGNREGDDLYATTKLNRQGQEDIPEFKLKLHSSLEKIQSQKQRTNLLKEKQERSNAELASRDIFNRLYEQNKALKERRERLIEEGRKSVEDKQTKECTFCPLTKSKLKTERAFNEEEIQHFYQKNIDWQLKREREIRLMQCEKNSEKVNDLTFTPQINNFKKKCKVNKENSQLPTERKPDSYLQRQLKGKKEEQLQQSKKPLNLQHKNIKKGYFSYVH